MGKDDKLLELRADVKNVYDKVAQLSDLKDIIFEDENMELVCDSIAVARYLKKGAEIYNMTKFRYFLKGLKSDNASEQQLNELYDYIDNSNKAEFISGVFKKIISSNSKLACYVMGIYMNEMIEKKKDITQTDMIILNALENINDFDIKNFKIIMEEGGNKKGNAVSETKLKKYVKENKGYISAHSID